MRTFFTLVTTVLLVLGTTGASVPFQMEDITRGVVAVKSDDGIYVGWRLLGTDPDSVAFNVYRGTTKLNAEPLTGGTNYLDKSGTTSDIYYVKPVIDNVEQTSSDTVSVWAQQYLTVPLDRPDGGTTSSGSYTYSPNDASVADLDGDGEYEIILKWDPSNSQDNSNSGYTGNTILDAYELDGTFLWRIDLGVNVRAGAHYSPFMVYDLDGDGKAELTVRTATGTKDASGAYISDGPAGDVTDHTKDYRNSSGYILSGPEFLTVFNGEDGLELETVDLEPNRGSASDWGDSYGNRVDRFLAAVVHLGADNPSIVWCRGIYEKVEICAWDYTDGELVQRWIFKSTDSGYSNWAGMGSHNLSVGDVDFDGKDEIIYGHCAIDDDGTGLWTLRSDIGKQSGDAMHLADMVPGRPGLERWACGEGDGPGTHLVDAATGEVLWMTDDADVGRCTAGDLSPDFFGMECWGGTDGLRSAGNEYVGSSPSSTNHVVWWDGDLGRELLDDVSIHEYVASGSDTELLEADGCASNNSTKANPCLQADIFGDWREEVIWRTDDNNIRIYTTVDTTKYRITTLMHDPQYRQSVCWQNNSYNQPPHTSFYLGFDMIDPLLPDSLKPSYPPANLAAVGKNGEVNLTWDEVLDDDHDGYNVYRADYTEDGTFVLLNTEALVAENAYADADVLTDSSYYYYVTAVDIEGNESSASNIEFIRPSFRPSYPEDIFTRSSATENLVVWEAVTVEEDEVELSGYNVYRSSNISTGYAKLNASVITKTTYTDETPSDGVMYYYYVKSVNTDELESFSSEIDSAQTGDSYTVQAENAIFSGVYSVDANHEGFNGEGFVNSDPTGTHILFTYMPGFEGEKVGLIYRWALGKDGRTGDLYVNGEEGEITMGETTDFTTWTTDTLALVLNPGFFNSIELVTTGEDFGNLDEITITTDFDTTLPVYLNGIVDLASDAYLSDIAVSVGELSPEFDKETVSYSVVLPAGTDSVDVSATTSSYYASVTGQGTVAITEGEGSRTLTVTAANGVTKDYTIDFAVTGIVDYTNNEFVIYPNPASSLVHVSDVENVNVSVYSYLGKLVIHKDNVTTIDISALERGLYIVKAQSENGGYISKLIIE